MKNSTLLILLALSIGLLLFTACSAPESGGTEVASASESDEHTDDDDHVEGDEHGQDEHNDEDDHDSGMDHMHVEAPEAFAALENPFAEDHETLEAGEETFNTLCATCHGEEGKGDGPGSAELDPKPADLSDHTMMSDLSDGYLFWRVTKGGTMEPFNSAMPSWEEGLTEEQRWQVIAYVRSLSEVQDHMEDMDDMHDDDHDDDHDG